MNVMSSSILFLGCAPKLTFATHRESIGTFAPKMVTLVKTADALSAMAICHPHFTL